MTLAAFSAVRSNPHRASKFLPGLGSPRGNVHSGWTRSQKGCSDDEFEDAALSETHRKSLGSAKRESREGACVWFRYLDAALLCPRARSQRMPGIQCFQNSVVQGETKVSGSLGDMPQMLVSSRAKTLVTRICSHKINNLHPFTTAPVLERNRVWGFNLQLNFPEGPCYHEPSGRGAAAKTTRSSSRDHGRRLEGVCRRNRRDGFGRCRLGARVKSPPLSFGLIPGWSAIGTVNSALPHSPRTRIPDRF